MKSASALGRKHVRLSAFVVVVVVAGLVLAVSAGARTTSSSKSPASPGLTSKAATDRIESAGDKGLWARALRPVQQPRTVLHELPELRGCSSISSTTSSQTTSSFPPASVGTSTPSRSTASTSTAPGPRRRST